MIRSVVNEAARLNPAIEFALPTYLTEDWTFSQGTLPAGSRVSQDPYIINRDPEFFENPDVFIPDRFVGEEGLKRMAKFHRFGLGPRKCLGSFYADYVMVFAIDRLVRNYKMDIVEMCPDARIEGFPIVNKKLPADKVRFTPRSF